MAVSQGDIALNLIATYRALGGGWQMRLIRDGGSDGDHVMNKPAAEAIPAPKGDH
jgi:hypothetical protein